MIIHEKACDHFLDGNFVSGSGMYLRNNQPVFLRQLIIPLIIVGIVYLLYRFPPRRLSKRPKVKPSKRTAAKVATQNQPLRKNSHQGKRKQYPFQVIEGQKGKSGDSSDDVPKYH